MNRARRRVVGVGIACLVVSASPAAAIGDCPADIAPPEGDYQVGFEDLTLLLAAWGPCDECPEDLYPPGGDGDVGFGDLSLLLSAWGPCPFVPASPNAFPQIVPTYGQQRVALFVCVANHTVPMTRTAQEVYEDLLDRSTPNSFANYIYEQSYGKLDLIGDVFGIYDVGAALYSNDIRAAVGTIASGGDVPDWSVYDRIIIATPSAAPPYSAYLNTVNFGQPWNPAGPYPDMPGFVGTVTMTNFAEQPLVVQNFTVQPATRIGWLIHEFGHALGLGHQVGVDCGPEWYDESNHSNSGPGFGMMPIGNNRHAHMLEKEYMRWLEPDQVQTVEANGRYTIHLRANALPSAPGGVQLVRILRSHCMNPSDVDDLCGGDEFGYYYVEFRRPVGFDAALFDTPWTPSGSVTNMDGPLVYVNAWREQAGTAPHTGGLLNMSPDDPPPAYLDWHYTDMELGVVYTEPNFGTTFELLSTDDEEAVIEVIATGF